MARLIMGIAVISASIIGVVAAGNSLSITQPQELKNSFTYEGFKGRIQERPSLFGAPPYGRQMRGQLYVPDDPFISGCSPIMNVSNANHPPFVFMLRRGNCNFAMKVRHAQDAGAIAVVVISDGNEIPTHMAIEGGESLIAIPSMIIKKSDGDHVVHYMKSNKEPAVEVSIEYGLDKTDVVSVDVWTSSLNPQSIGFNQLGEFFAPLQIEEKLKVNIHYMFVRGETYHCDRSTLLCGNQCTNTGKYCAVDPDHDLSSGTSGAEVVQENLRRICLVQLAYEQKDFELPWKYANNFWHSCAVKSTVSEECSTATLGALKPEMSAAVQKCVADSGGADIDSKNKNLLIENELQLKEENNIYLIPSFSVNKTPYFGTTSCRSPLSFESCPIGETMCNGFSESSMPSICRTSVGCEFGKARDACGQCADPNSSDFITDKDLCLTRSGGVSIGTVIVLIIVFITILIGAAYVYHQHSAVKMRDELRNIMSQYVPLEGDSPTQDPLVV